MDITSPLSGADSSSKVVAPSQPESAFDQEKKFKSSCAEEWSQIIKRETNLHGQWRNLHDRSLLSGTAQDNMSLELPQIWGVTENGLNNAEAPLRVPICKVRFLSRLHFQGLFARFEVTFSAFRTLPNLRSL